jgi:putative N-acetylmannosamine-6-phosphate epimerase
MEHRCSDRYTADIKILIHKYQLPVAIGRIKNGSRYGLFIESDLVDVKPLQQLGIEILAYPGTQKLQRYKFDSIVIHTTDHGFGIELDALSEEEEDQLMDLLQDAPVTPQESELYAMVANA